MARIPGTELYEYMPPSAGVSESNGRGPGFPYYLSDRPRPGAPSMNGRGPQGPDVNLRAIGKVITAGTMAGLLFGAPIWGKPVLSIARYPKATNLVALLESVVTTLGQWLRPRINKLSGDISKGSVHLNGDLTHTLDLLALRMEQIVLNQAFGAADVTWAVGQLVHFKIPSIVKHGIRPVELKVGHIIGTTIRLTIRIKNVEKYVITKVEAPIKHDIKIIKKTIRTTIIKPIRTIERDVKTIKRTLVKHDLRIKQLTFILVPALASAWLIKTLIRSGLRFVTCQNVKDFGNELCASPPGTGRGLARFWRNFGSLLGDLAALSFVPLLLTDACRIMGVIEGLAIQAQPLIDDFVLGIEGFVCGGRQSAPSGIVDSDYVRASSSLSGT